MNKKDIISKLLNLKDNIQNQLDNKADLEHTHDGIGGPPEDHTHESIDITDLQSKLDEKANLSHTHTVSNISDFPTSLPANGGNADTVDGKHASDFSTTDHNHDDRYLKASEGGGKETKCNYEYVSVEVPDESVMTLIDYSVTETTRARINTYQYYKGSISISIDGRALFIDQQPYRMRSYNYGYSGGEGAESDTVAVMEVIFNSNLTITAKGKYGSSGETDFNMSVFYYN